MSTDPAVDAAQRAWESEGFEALAVAHAAVAAAREALAPLRELHQPGEITVRRKEFEPESQRVCDHCDDGFQPWPCDTAKLIYTSEELK